jgi:RNA polymerase sigma-70 factor (ECF subfamily)
MSASKIQQFEAYRPLMFSIAYRMLGSITETEDILQEAFLRYQGAAAQEIVSPKAFLSTIVTRLCLNRLESAQSRRELYVGPWLPEPILTDANSVDMTERAELHESLSVAFLVLLEQLTPMERAVFLLRQVFDYEYSEIA